MDELKLEWKKFHAFPFVRDSQCREARTGVLVLHAFPDGDWAAGMHLAWDLRLRGKTAPDLVEAMRAAEAALFAELRPYGAESQLMENWRATREEHLVSWLRDREARKRREFPAPAQDRAVRRDRFVHNERLSNLRVDVFMQAGEHIAEVELRDVASRQRIGLVFRLRTERTPHNRKVRENLIAAIRAAGGDGHGYLRRAGAAYRIWRAQQNTSAGGAWEVGEE